MIGWLLALAGTLVAAAGMTVAVGAVAVSRVELFRWISQRLPRTGSRTSAVLAVPGRVLGAATGLAAIGCIVAASGVTVLVASLPLFLEAITVLLVAIPVMLSLIYALPRALGQRWAEPIVKEAVPWLDRLGSLFSPLVPGAPDARPRAALAALLHADREAAEKEDVVGMLTGVLHFTERPVREIMTPRTDIVATREGAPLDEVGQIFAESGYSRIPVYHDSLDNIVGMIYALDLLKLSPGADLPIRPVAMAPASKRCADLLFEMQRDRHHFAVLLDEYGGTAGIATFQDLLAELVAEVFSEAENRPPREAAGGDLIETSGSTPCEEVVARFGVALLPPAETIGGLLAHAAGRIPQTGERFSLAGLEFDVLAATPTRVERVLVRRGPVPVVRLIGGENL